MNVCMAESFASPVQVARAATPLEGAGGVLQTQAAVLNTEHGDTKESGWCPALMLSNVFEGWTAR